MAYIILLVMNPRISLRSSDGSFPHWRARRMALGICRRGPFSADHFHESGDIGRLSPMQAQNAFRMRGIALQLRNRKGRSVASNQRIFANSHFDSQITCRFTARSSTVDSTTISAALSAEKSLEIVTRLISFSASSRISPLAAPSLSRCSSRF